MSKKLSSLSAMPMLKKKNTVLASALISALAASSVGYAETQLKLDWVVEAVDALCTYADGSPFDPSNPNKEEGVISITPSSPPATLKLYFQDVVSTTDTSSGEPKVTVTETDMVAPVDYRVDLNSGNAENSGLFGSSVANEIVSQFIFPAGVAQKTITIGFAGTGPKDPVTKEPTDPDVVVSSEALGKTSLLSFDAIANTDTVFEKSNQIQLSILGQEPDNIINLSGSTKLRDKSSIGQWVTFNLETSDDSLLNDKHVNITHVVDGKCVETLDVPSINGLAYAQNEFIGENQVKVAFREPTTIKDAAGQYTFTEESYIVSVKPTDGSNNFYPPAVIKSTGDAATPDFVIPTLPPMASNANEDYNAYGGISLQVGTFFSGGHDSLFSKSVDSIYRISPEEDININMAIDPVAAHVGMKADKIIAGIWADVFNILDGTDFAAIDALYFYVDTNSSYMGWNYIDEPTPPATVKGKTLQSKEAFHVFSGKLPFLGQYLFFSGYQLYDGPVDEDGKPTPGTMVFNEEPGQVIVQTQAGGIILD